MCYFAGKGSNILYEIMNIAYQVARIGCEELGSCRFVLGNCIHSLCSYDIIGTYLMGLPHLSYGSSPVDGIHEDFEHCCTFFMS